MGSPPKLTIEERILLVLVDNLRYRDEFEVPPALTQEGLSSLIGANRPNVSRSLGSLREKGMIVERLSHVIGQRRRKKVYMVGEKAMDAALSIRDAVSRSEADGVRLEDLAKRSGMDLSSAFLLLSSGKGLEGPHAAAPPAPQAERPFFGRAEELSRIRAWMSRKGAPVLVVFGIAGIGKTSLVHKALDGRKGCRWVHIMRSSTLEGVLHQIEVALSGKGGFDLKSSPSVPVMAQGLADSLSRSGILLVLDDVHHADARFSELMSALVRSGRELKVICTSRSRGSFYTAREVRASGEVTEVELKGLGREDALEMMRARRIPPEEADRIWKRFGGHPIALVLASGREDLEASRDVSDFIRNDVLLSIPEGDLAALKAFSVLRRPTPDPYSLLRSGGIDPASLERLIDRGIVESQQGGTWVHSLIGSVVSERMPRDEWARLHSLAADHWMASSEGYPSVIEALHHLALSGRREEFIDLLRSKGSGALGEGFVELLLIVEELDPSGLSAEGSVLVHTIKADGESLIGNVPKARSELEAALPNVGSVKGLPLRLLFMERMGEVLRMSGDPSGAVPYLSEGMDSFNGIRDPSPEDVRRAISILNSIGLCHAAMGRAEASRECFRKGIGMAKGYDPGGSLPVLYLNLGRTFLGPGSADAALSELSSGLEAANALDDPRTASLILTAMGEAMALKGSHGEALDHFEKALLSDPSRSELGWMAKGYSDPALPRKGGSALMERIGSFLRGRRAEEDRRISGIYSRICRTEMERGMPPSIDMHEKACSIFRERGMRRDLLRAMNNLGSARMMVGDLDGAVRTLSSALEEERAHPDPRSRAIILYNLGRALGRSGARPGSLSRLKESLDIAEDLGMDDLVRTIRSELN